MRQISACMLNTFLDCINLLCPSPDAWQEEFDHWKTRSECRLDMRGDVSANKIVSIISINHFSTFTSLTFSNIKDQSIHNYLYYTNRFKNAITIPHRTGPIHVVGYQVCSITPYCYGLYLYLFYQSFSIAYSTGGSHRGADEKWRDVQ